jgi:hypothetical protein
MRGSRRCDPPRFWSSQRCCLPPQLSCTLRKRGRKGGQVAEARGHIPLRRRMPPLPLTSRAPPRLPKARHLALRRRMGRGPGPGWPRLTLLRHVSRHLLHDSRNALMSPHRMLPPRLASPLRAACRSTPLLAGARRPVARPQNQSRLRRYPALLARRNERGSTPLHLHLLRKDDSAATSRLKGNPLATRSLIMVAPRVKLAQSPSPLSPQIATEIEMQIGR